MSTFTALRGGVKTRTIRNGRIPEKTKRRMRARIEPPTDLVASPRKSLEIFPKIMSTTAMKRGINTCRDRSSAFSPPALTIAVSASPTTRIRRTPATGHPKKFEKPQTSFESDSERFVDSKVEHQNHRTRHSEYGQDWIFKGIG